MGPRSDLRTVIPATHIRAYQGLRLLRQRLHSPVIVTLDCAPQRTALRELAQGLVAGGAGIVRLAGAGLTTRRMVDQMAQTVWTCRGMGALCLLEARVDVALAVMADGVHLEATDMPVALARRMMGPGATIGVVCHSLADAREAGREGASYVALADVFGGEPGEGAERLALLAPYAEQSGLPVCAGWAGSPEELALLRERGAHLIAVRAPLGPARDAQAALRQLVSAFNRPATGAADAQRSPDAYSPQPSL